MNLKLKSFIDRHMKNRLAKSERILARYKDVFPAPVASYYLDLCRAVILEESCSTIAHLGCGRDRSGVFSDHWFGDRFIVGIDLDRLALGQYKPGDRVQGDLGYLPLRDSCVDIACSEMVFEHLEQPVSVMKEIWRILRPGGVLVFATPNKYAYQSLVARFTPYKFHLAFSRLVNPAKRVEEEKYPTYYRFNSCSRINTVLTRIGFRKELLTTYEGAPGLLGFSPMLTRIGIIYHRLLVSHQFLAVLRILIVGMYGK